MRFSLLYSAPKLHNICLCRTEGATSAKLCVSETESAPHWFVFSFFSSLAHVSRVCSACDFVALVCFGNLKADHHKEQREDLRESSQGRKKKRKNVATNCVFVSKSNKTHSRDDKYQRK